MKRAALVIALLALAVASPAQSAPIPTLHRYQTGKQVRGLQWLLSAHRPSIYKIRTYTGPINGHYDLRTVRAVRAMRYRLGWANGNLSGATAGPFFIQVLKGKATRPFAYRLRAGKRVIARQKRLYNLAHPPISDRIRTLIADANYLIAHANQIGYSQTRRMEIVRLRLGIPPLNRYIYEDCSSSITGLYWLAAGGSATNPYPTGLPDPNGPIGGREWSGYGYTGTQSAHGKVVWRLGQPLSLLRPGDIVFYGGGWPHHHETMVLGNGRVFSHGTNTGPFNLPVLYRPDAVGAHRYVTVP